MQYTGGLYNQLVNRKEGLIPERTTDPVSATFAALADPTRRAILETLSKGEATVKELAGPFAMTQPAISKHLKVLERAGLITRGREAQSRPCRLNPGALKHVDAWMDRYRRFYQDSLDRLDEHLQNARKGTP